MEPKPILLLQQQQQFPYKPIDYDRNTYITCPLFPEAPKLDWSAGGEKRRAVEIEFFGDAYWEIAHPE